MKKTVLESVDLGGYYVGSRAMSQVFGLVAIRTPRDAVILGTEFTLYTDGSCMTPLAHVVCARMSAFRFTDAAPSTIFVRCHRPVWTNAGAIGELPEASVPPVFVNRSMTEIGIAGGASTSPLSNHPAVIEPLWDARNPDNRSWGGGRTQTYYHPFAQQGITRVPVGGVPLAQSSAVETQTRQYFPTNSAAAGYSDSPEFARQYNLNGTFGAGATTSISRSSGLIWGASRETLSVNPLSDCTPYRAVTIGSDLANVDVVNRGPYSLFLILGWRDSVFSSWSDFLNFDLLLAGAAGAHIWSLDVAGTAPAARAPVSRTTGSNVQGYTGQVSAPLQVDWRFTIPASLIARYFPTDVGLGPLQIAWGMAPAVSSPRNSFVLWGTSYVSGRGEPLYASTNLRTIGGST